MLVRCPLLWWSLACQPGLRQASMEEGAQFSLLEAKREQLVLARERNWQRYCLETVSARHLLAT